MASTTYAQHQLKTGFLVGMHRFFALKCEIHAYFSEFVVLTRNAGQLPQPFWLGAARGGGSYSAARSCNRP